MAFDRLDSVGLAYLWGKLKAFFATKSLVGDTTMGTTATTVTGAIKEHSDLIGSTTMGTTASTLTGAIAEHESDISNLNSNLSHPNRITTMPTSFNNTAIYYFGATNLDSSFPQANMYGTVIVIPSNDSGTTAMAIILCNYPDKAYLGEYLSNSSGWSWTALN